jgi:hypothetical protein
MREGPNFSLVDLSRGHVSEYWAGKKRTRHEAMQHEGVVPVVSQGGGLSDVRHIGGQKMTLMLESRPSRTHQLRPRSV